MSKALAWPFEATREVVTALRLAVRRTSRRPRNAVFACLVLASILALVLPPYALLQGVLLRGLPVPHGQRIVAVSTGEGALSWSRPDDYQWLSSHFESLEELAAMRNFNSSVTPEGGVTSVVPRSG